jgi:hypothetical protein
VVAAIAVTDFRPEAAPKVKSGAVVEAAAVPKVIATADGAVNDDAIEPEPESVIVTVSAVVLVIFTHA